MNRLIFDRSTGSLRPNAFARLQSTRLIYSIQQAPNYLFDGGESSKAHLNATGADVNQDDGSLKACAHIAGVNALAVDRFDGRL
jgi:DNA excision repair protein ERCC-8